MDIKLLFFWSLGYFFNHSLYCLWTVFFFVFTGKNVSLCVMGYQSLLI